MTPGEAAYKRANQLRIDTYVQPPWDDLIPDWRNRWEEIAQVAIEAHRALNACSCNRPSIGLVDNNHSAEDCVTGCDVHGAQY